MREPKRVGLDMLEPSLKELISSNFKIQIITQDQLDNNLNPGELTYGRVDRTIYVWVNNTWQYLIADDVDISWTEIKEKPVSFNPMAHTHDELHAHTNKLVLDSITQGMVDYIALIPSKADTAYVNTELDKKALATHNHDDKYSALLHTHDYSADFADIAHTHDYSEDFAVKSVEGDVSDHEGRLAFIEGGYSTGHSHENLTELSSITEAIITSIETIGNKADKTYVDSGLLGKVATTTFTGHTGNTTVHVTQIDKDNWDGKLNAEDLPAQKPAYTLGTVKPTDGSMWLQEI